MKPRARCRLGTLARCRLGTLARCRLGALARCCLETRARCRLGTLARCFRVRLRAPHARAFEPPTRCRLEALARCCLETSARCCLESPARCRLETPARMLPWNQGMFSFGTPHGAATSPARSSLRAPHDVVFVSAARCHFERRLAVKTRARCRPGTGNSVAFESWITAAHGRLRWHAASGRTAKTDMQRRT